MSEKKLNPVPKPEPELTCSFEACPAPVVLLLQGPTGETQEAFCEAHQVYCPQPQLGETLVTILPQKNAPEPPKKQPKKQPGQALAPRDNPPPSQELEPVQDNTPAVRRAQPPGEIMKGQGFAGAGQLLLSTHQQLALQEPLDPEIVDIRPDGFIYVPQIYYRKKLNKVLGAGNWALVPQNNPMVQDNRIVIHYHLYIHGRFAADAVGSMAYQAKSRRAKWDDCVEGAKSDALRRCCKDIAIFPEVWEWKWAQVWKKTYAVLVDVVKWDGKRDRWWRHKDKDPYPEESIRKPGRDGESEYTKVQTYKQEVEAHFNNIE